MPKSGTLPVEHLKVLVTLSKYGWTGFNDIDCASLGMTRTRYNYIRGKLAKKKLVEVLDGHGWKRDYTVRQFRITAEGLEAIDSYRVVLRDVQTDLLDVLLQAARR